MMARRNDPDLFGDTTGFDDAPDRESEDVTLTLALHGEIGKSIKVSETGDDAKTVLLPKSEVTWKATGQRTTQVGRPKYAVVEVKVPVWIAKNRGLV